MLCVHDSNFVLEVQYVNGMVSHTYALEVLSHLPRYHSCVKVNQIAQLGVPCFIRFIDEEASCLPLRSLVCVPVGDVGVMYGFGFGADHTSRVVGNRFVVDLWTFRTG